MMKSLPADLKNFPAPQKLDLKKIAERVGDVIGFLASLIVFAAALLILTLAAASVAVPSQLQTTDEPVSVSEVRI
jgi:hypothetical protein